MLINTKPRIETLEKLKDLGLTVRVMGDAIVRVGADGKALEHLADVRGKKDADRALELILVGVLLMATK